jgi:preprotein translocase subunit SecD
VANYFVLEDDTELSGSDIKNPEQNFDQRTQEPIVTMEYTDEGQKAFAAVTKRIAERGAKILLPPGSPRDAALQRFAITLDNEIVSLATIDFRENPEGIDGRTGSQINGIGSVQDTQDLAEMLAIGPLPLDLKLLEQR